MNYVETVNLIFNKLSSADIEEAKRLGVGLDEGLCINGGFGAEACEYFIDEIDGDDQAKQDCINAIYNADESKALYFGEGEDNEYLKEILSDLIK